MSQLSNETNYSRILRFAHTDQSLCWFTALPNGKGIFCKNNSSTKYSVLDLNTLVAKQNLSVDPRMWMQQPVHRHFPDGASWIIPGFEIIEINSLLGSRTILIELVWGRGTTRSYVKTSAIDFDKSRVSVINQLELPVQNGAENWSFDMRRDSSCTDRFFCMFFWEKNGRTALSLARIAVTSKSGDIKCETIANERLIGEYGWSTSSVMLAGDNIYLLNDDGELNKMLEHSFDGTRTIPLTLKSYLGKYPQSGYTVEGWFEDCWIAFIRPQNMPGQLWALDVAARQWLNLGIIISEHMPCGHNKLEILKNGKAYLLAMCASRCPEKAHVYTFHIKYRLVEARAAIKAGPPSAFAAAPPPYSKNEVESTHL